MIRILNIGMNHETAPVELRECLSAEEGIPIRVLGEMRDLPCIREGLFLSTCNRVEALCITEEPAQARRSVIAMMSRYGGMLEERLLSSLYILEDMEAVKHVYRVAASLDSMVVGEPQILGQIKDSYVLATREKTSGVILNRLMHRAFHVAKRVRTETGISDAAVSVSYAAVELARKIFYDLRGRRVLLIGAGEMAELAARHLLGQGVSGVRVANRTFHRAMQVAETFQGEPVSFDEIPAQLLEVDIVISSTASAEYVITHKQVKGCLRGRKNRPLFFIDIAVPRDVEPRVNDLGNVYVYDIDDLKGVVEINLSQRKQEAVKAERIVEEEVIKFERWLKTLAVVPTIVSLREKAEAIRQAELRKSLHGLGDLSSERVKMIEALTLSIAEKIINDPILVLKEKAERSTRDSFLDITRTLFRLDANHEQGDDNGHQQDD
ncbi:MAG: glutamyl-tRNA reductase [Deltaproteobacteria bacterium]|nr:glutamyl-tRNA reductase [Deltaproteobacteria bacterium]